MYILQTFNQNELQTFYILNELQTEWITKEIKMVRYIKKIPKPMIICLKNGYFVKLVELNIIIKLTTN